MNVQQEVPQPTKSDPSRRLKDFSIELDCPPGQIRPDGLIAGVLKDTGLAESDFQTGPPFFGEQVWILRSGDDERDALFTRSKPVLKQRISALYHAGIIRWGSW